MSAFGIVAAIGASVIPAFGSPLGLKVLFGAPLIPIGFWISVLALRRRAHGHDLLGLFIFLCGGLIGGIGVLMVVE